MKVLSDEFDMLVRAAAAHIRLTEQRSFEELERDDVSQIANHPFLISLNLELAVDNEGWIEIDPEVAERLSELVEYTDRIQYCYNFLYEEEDWRPVSDDIYVNQNEDHSDYKFRLLRE